MTRSGPRAQPQAVAAAGLRAWPRHGDRRAGEGAAPPSPTPRGLSTPTLDLIAALAIQKARDKELYAA